MIRAKLISYEHQKKMKKLSLISAIVATLVLSGCNSIFGTSANPDARLTSEEFQVESSSYASSCVVGAAVTGVSCLFIVNSDRKALCLAAAAAGCAAGMGTNALLDNIRKNYHTKEAQLDALLDQLQANREKAVQLNAAARTVYKEDHAKFLQLQNDIKNNKATSENLKQAIAQYDANNKVIADNIKAHEEKLGKFLEVRKELIANEKLTAQEKKKLKELDLQIANLQKTVDELRGVHADNVYDRNVLNLTLEKGVPVNA